MSDQNSFTHARPPQQIPVHPRARLLARERVNNYEAAICNDLTYALADILMKNGNGIDLVERNSDSWEEFSDLTLLGIQRMTGDHTIPKSGII
ncbi:MAG: hypothetical protein EA364_00435 [Balneolaceae bacterium]|nr:MAG: hypothetical protein EA364_00435 [Balneolaceae bacterium]